MRVATISTPRLARPAGRTARGFAETSRALYRRSITDHALPVWRAWKLADVEPTDVRQTVCGAPRRRNFAVGTNRASARRFRRFRDGRGGPGCCVPTPSRASAAPLRAREPEEGRASALTRAELSLLLAALAEEWRLFFEFLADTGLRISEALALRWDRLTSAGGRGCSREKRHEGKRRRLKSRQGRRDIPLSAGMRDRPHARRRDGYRGEHAPVFATATGPSCPVPTWPAACSSPRLRRSG